MNKEAQQAIALAINGTVTAIVALTNCLKNTGATPVVTPTKKEGRRSGRISC